MASGLLLALTLPLAAGRADAQEADDLDAQEIPERTINTGQRNPADVRDGYGGVTPGEGTPRKPRRPNRLTWLGFQVKDDGTATLFVQLTSEVPFTQEVTGNKLLVRLEGARFANRNARRRLDTRFFETALQQVTSRAVPKRRARGDQPARAAGVELTVAFKNPEDAREASAEIRQEQDGYHYLYLSFGAAGVRPSGAATDAE
ncbi:MAG TPA: hypothetical protein VNM90_06725 [Haliangium sp.]|nr:hypothetical protein [Haliangium sp.]